MQISLILQKKLPAIRYNIIVRYLETTHPENKKLLKPNTLIAWVMQSGCWTEAGLDRWFQGSANRFATEKHLRSQHLGRRRQPRVLLDLPRPDFLSACFRGKYLGFPFLPLGREGTKRGLHRFENSTFGRRVKWRKCYKLFICSNFSSMRPLRQQSTKHHQRQP